jgi:hypothetical protein
LTDEEMTKLCAEAMGLSTWLDARGILCLHDSMCSEYEPLYDDWQAMALMKRFMISIDWYVDGEATVVLPTTDTTPSIHVDGPLNRAVVECVAKMQASKRTEAV